MFKIALLIWLMAGATLAGCFILVTLMLPTAYGHSEMQWVPIAGIVGFLIAMPFSYMIARRIDGRPAH